MARRGKVSYQQQVDDLNQIYQLLTASGNAVLARPPRDYCESEGLPNRWSRQRFNRYITVLHDMKYLLRKKTAQGAVHYVVAIGRGPITLGEYRRYLDKQVQKIHYQGNAGA